MLPVGNLGSRRRNIGGTLSTEDGAHFDQEIVIDCATISPTVTWGTSPQEAISIDGQVPSLVPEKWRRSSLYGAIPCLHGT